jgi:N-acetylglutamate synthase-like GNAT family acetyltransferase/DNA-binding MarR family transcriptional regulator
MLSEKNVNNLRFSARKLVRELGMLELNTSRSNRKPQEWHALIEISVQRNITIAKLAHLLVLSSSSVSRIVNMLITEKLVMAKSGGDNREKYLNITDKGKVELKKIDEYSNFKIRGAAEFLSKNDLQQITFAMQKYANALEKSRLSREQVKIHTLSTSRPIRKQIVNMIEKIQINEFSLPITPSINPCVLKAEEEFYFNKSYNFWYAIDNSGTIIGSIGLKQIDKQNAEIKKFFVDKNYRSKGVAQKLLYSLTDSAVRHGFKYLYLGCILHSAQAFYAKYGFEKITHKELPVKFEKGQLDTVFIKIKVNDLQNKIALEIK